MGVAMEIFLERDWCCLRQQGQHGDGRSSQPWMYLKVELTELGVSIDVGWEGRATKWWAGHFLSWRRHEMGGGVWIEKTVTQILSSQPGRFSAWNKFYFSQDGGEGGAHLFYVSASSVLSLYSFPQGPQKRLRSFPVLRSWKEPWPPSSQSSPQDVHMHKSACMRAHTHTHTYSSLLLPRAPTISLFMQLPLLL